MELKSGYKQTEVGVIPEDWGIDVIKNAYEIRNDLRLPLSENVRKKMQGPYPYYGPTKAQDYINEYRVEGEYCLIGEDGDHFLKWKDMPMTLLVRGKFNVNNHAHLVCGIRNETTWFYYYFKNRDITRHLTRQGAGRYKLTKGTLENIPLAIPPTKAEQTSIANALSDADALIQSLTRLIAKKRQIKQGAMQTLLNPYENGQLKEGWIVKKLGEFLEYEQPTKYLVTDTEYNDNNNTPVLTAGKTFILGYTHENFGIFNTGFPVIIFDDFTTTSKFVTFPFKVKSSAMKILKKKNEKINIRFVFEIMQRIVFALGDHKRHWIAEFQHLHIHVPENEMEQLRIATILSGMDAEIAALETKLAKYRHIKQGMMQNLLTGRIRLVKTESNTGAVA